MIEAYKGQPLGQLNETQTKPTEANCITRLSIKMDQWITMHDLKKLRKINNPPNKNINEMKKHMTGFRLAVGVHILC